MSSSHLSPAELGEPTFFGCCVRSRFKVCSVADGRPHRPNQSLLFDVKPNRSTPNSIDTSSACSDALTGTGRAHRQQAVAASITCKQESLA